MSYWDTSALAKLYVTEPDSHDFELHVPKAAQLTVSETGRLELRTVLRRREGEGSLSTGATDLLHRSFCSLIAADQFVEEPRSPAWEQEFFAILDACLGNSPPIFLRTNDALHLAAARRANETEVVTTDEGLRKAALFLGLQCSLHPDPAENKYPDFAQSGGCTSLTRLLPGSKLFRDLRTARMPKPVSPSTGAGIAF